MFIRAQTRGIRLRAAAVAVAGLLLAQSISLLLHFSLVPHKCHGHDPDRGLQVVGALGAPAGRSEGESASDDATLESAANLHDEAYQTCIFQKYLTQKYFDTSRSPESGMALLTDGETRSGAPALLQSARLFLTAPKHSPPLS